MSFSTEIKNEVCSLKLSRVENISFLSGFVRNNKLEDVNKISLVTENPKIIRYLYNLFNEQEKVVKAVNNISFNVKEGETVAFIGPNGAGKSTTIKMLTGILYPTKGDIKICGLTPIKDRNKLAFKIGTVFGLRSQLLPNLPLTESMEMFGAMYDMDKVAIKKKINELSELFDLKEFI